MKNSPFVVSSFAFLSLTAASTASVYYTSFNGFSLADLDGQGGWSADVSTPDAGYVQSIAGSPWNGRAASIGYVDPLSATSAYVSHAASTPLIGGVNATFSALFQVQDSDEGFGAGAEARDTFGFRLENATGDNLFSFYLNPDSQVSDPSVQTAKHGFSWSTGLGAPTVVLPGLFAIENNAYTFTIAFNDAGGGNVGFNADVNGVGFSGVLTGLASEEIAEFGAFWNPLDTTFDPEINPGSNFMIFDEVNLVPEPSSALLGLLGASFAFLRRRRA